MPAILDEKQNLSGNVWAQVGQPASPRVRRLYINTSTLQVGQGRSEELELKLR
jgi:hypothetical protein